MANHRDLQRRRRSDRRGVDPHALLGSVVATVVLAACPTADEFVQDGDEAERQARAAVYAVEGHRVDRQAVDALRETFQILEGGVLENNGDPASAGTLDYLDTADYQAVPTYFGAQTSSEEGDGEYTVQGFDLAAIRDMPEPPGGDTALQRVEGAFDGAGIHPSTRFLPAADKASSLLDGEPLWPKEYWRLEHSVGHSRFEMIASDGLTEVARELDTQVIYSVSLTTGNLAGSQRGMVRLRGPGADVKVALEPDDSASRVRYTLPRMRPVTTTPIRSPRAAAEACLEAYRSEVTTVVREGQAGEQEVAPVELTAEADLSYYAADPAADAVRIWPFYRCEGTRIGPDGDPVALRSRWVTASTDPAAPRMKEFQSAALDALRANASAAPAAAPAMAPTYPFREIGIEWIGEAGGLGGSKDNANGYYETFKNNGYNAKFNWGNNSAWEQDFKTPSRGGTDPDYADDVDAVFFTGHANGNGFNFSSSVDDGKLHWRDAEWGDEDLEWLTIAACGPLQKTAGGDSWARRWAFDGDGFSGLHILMGYANVSKDNRREGTILASSMLGVNGWRLLPVRLAWVRAAEKVQDSGVTHAYMGVYDSDYRSNFNDWFWGKVNGGGPDIDPGQIAGAWRVASPS